MISKKGRRVLAMPQNKTLQSVFLFEWIPCFRQDRMLIPVLTLDIFIKERRINVGRRATEVWFCFMVELLSI